MPRAASAGFTQSLHGGRAARRASSLSLARSRRRSGACSAVLAATSAMCRSHACQAPGPAKLKSSLPNTPEGEPVRIKLRSESGDITFSDPDASLGEVGLEDVMDVLVKTLRRAAGDADGVSLTKGDFGFRPADD